MHFTAPAASGTFDPQAISETFDRWVLEGKATGMERRHKRLAERMLERIPIEGDACVLDIGCGDGWLARMLAPSMPLGACVGIDLSFQMIHAARRACRELDNALFAPAPAEAIPWAENYFTHVLSIESAYYWPNLTSAAREIHRVARYGGSFHILINYYAENSYSEGWDLDVGVPMHRLATHDWEALFRDNGFENVSSDRIPDDSPIPAGKSPEELARREGLQREGALYITGRKPALPQPTEPEPTPPAEPFRVLP